MNALQHLSKLLKHHWHNKADETLTSEELAAMVDKALNMAGVEEQREAKNGGLINSDKLDNKSNT